MVRDKPEADTNPQSWEDDEESKLLDMIKSEKDKSDMYKAFPDRPEASIDNKVRRLKKSNGLYNRAHASEKYRVNEDWISEVDSNNRGSLRVFDAYAGKGDSSKIYNDFADNIVACELEEEVHRKLSSNLSNQETIQTDCVDELMKRVADGEKFDFIDLDPFGTPFDAIPLSIKLITNGYMAVTYGDIKLQRWGRTNVLVKQYKMPETTDWEEVASYMIGWTVFEGIRQRKSSDVRIIKPVSVKRFDGQTGVLRVLYKVQKTGVLSDALEYYEKNSVDNGKNLANRPFDVNFDSGL